MKLDKLHISSKIWYHTSWQPHILLLETLHETSVHLIEVYAWDLYLSSFSEMLLYFAASEHSNYTRWSIIFLAHMKMLPQTAPEVQQKFELAWRLCHKGDSQHVQSNSWQPSTGASVNKSGKVGLVGITRTDSARDRWYLTYNECSKLSEDTKEMFDILERECTSAKALGKARMRHDAVDVATLEVQFTEYEAFRCTVLCKSNANDNQRILWYIGDI